MDKAHASIGIRISSFQGDYRFLSNFYPANVLLDGMKYPTVEHAFQAAKVPPLGYMRTKIRNASEPSIAKRLGRSVALRPDWEQVKVDVMLDLLRWKFSFGGLLAGKLLSTGDTVLEEGNNWGDTFWGTVGGKGKNMLGILLMVVREELKKKEAVAAAPRIAEVEALLDKRGVKWEKQTISSVSGEEDEEPAESVSARPSLPFENEARAMGYSLHHRSADRSMATYTKNGVWLGVTRDGEGHLDGELGFLGRMLTKVTASFGLPHPNFTEFEEHIFHIKHIFEDNGLMRFDSGS